MKPFLHGKKTVAFTSLRPAPGMNAATVASASAPVESLAHAASHAHTHPAGKPSAPTVEAVKEGDKVVRLIVTCSCGERIEVQCLYPTK